MATYDNPTVDTTGTDADDTFIFNKPIGPTTGTNTTVITVAGAGGRDTLVYQGVEQGLYDLIIGSDGQFSGEIRTAFAGRLRFSQFEVAQFTGSSATDNFRLTVNGPVNPADVTLDGGGGGSGLSLGMQSNAPLTFTASGTSATSSVGNFTNFAAFGLGLGSGADNVRTSDGNDTIGQGATSGPQGFDTVYAGGGDDTVDFLSAGFFDGGEGFDLLRYMNAADIADFRFGMAADGTITSNRGTFVSFERFVFRLGSGNDGVITGAGDDFILGGAGNDYIQTGAGNDVLYGNGGANTLIGGPGDDTYHVDGTADILVESPGEGYDTVFARSSFTLGHGSNIEALIAFNGSNFTLTGNELDNMIVGTIGDDVLIGRAGADSLDGGPPDGIDTASYAGDGGAVFVNLTLGQGFTNTSFGDTYINIDNVIGTSFNDFLIGDTGVNRLDGADGNDTIIGGIGADVLVGGSGTDLLSFEDNSGVVFVNLMTGLGYNNAAEGDSLSGFENVIGGLFDDTLIGDDGSNRIDGAKGADTLVGNGGADTFVFANMPDFPSPYLHPNANANVETILDFVSGQDKLEIKASIFGGDLSAGPLAAERFVLGTRAADADDRFIYDQANGRLYFDFDGSGSFPHLLVAVFPNHAPIAASDFVVV